MHKVFLVKPSPLYATDSKLYASRRLAEEANPGQEVIESPFIGNLADVVQEVPVSPPPSTPQVEEAASADTATDAAPAPEQAAPAPVKKAKKKA